ncbi:hypothetical protein D3C87_1960750 [compost metagenome]
MATLLPALVAERSIELRVNSSVSSLKSTNWNDSSSGLGYSRTKRWISKAGPQPTLSTRNGRPAARARSAWRVRKSISSSMRLRCAVATAALRKAVLTIWK